MSIETITQTHLTAFEEYLLREEKSAATVEKYLRDARAFVLYAEGKTVTKEMTVAYKKSLEDTGYKPRSINSMIASLNSFLDFLGVADCKVKTLRIQKPTYLTEEKELTKDEYKRLLAAAKHKEQLNLVIRTICATGIRVSELKYFTVEAVRNGEVSVKCKSKTRTILVPGDLRKLLLSYAHKHGITDGVIFVTRNRKPLDRSYIWAQMKGLCEGAGVNPSKVFPHNLRKLFARTFYGIEKDIAKLADILGHSSIETTRIYIMTTGSEHRRQIERMGIALAERYA
ncbi:MAG: tyrosine-type recombinase/integrase [Clostridia bacterium]|nr:tyrosine-type recombinase/integrase [Clostridia bacterium]